MRASFRSFLVAGLSLAALAAPGAASAGIFMSVSIAPPVLPVYVQPPVPAPGYIWTPGYWAYGDAGYFWVPGTWVQPPSVGLLWTPGYWGWGDGGVYLWHAGYWGPHVGFYGGINYGFGYGGAGYVGGRWDHGVFAYNRSVNNVNVTVIHNVYNEPVRNTVVTRVAFNGGAAGVRAEPTPGELAAEHETHVPVTSLQAQHQEAAAANRAQLASVNHGRPAVAASPRPGMMSGRGVVAAHAPGGAPHPVAAVHPGGEARPAVAQPHPARPAAQARPEAPHGEGHEGHEPHEGR